MRSNWTKKILLLLTTMLLEKQVYVTCFRYAWWTFLVIWPVLGLYGLTSIVFIFLSYNSGLSPYKSITSRVLVTLKHLSSFFNFRASSCFFNSTSSSVSADLEDAILKFELKSRVPKELWMKTLGNLIGQCFSFALSIHGHQKVSVHTRKHFIICFLFPGSLFPNI